MLGYAPNTLHNYKQGIAKSCAYFIAKNGEINNERNMERCSGTGRKL
jgi:hypothetical protein